MNGSGRLMGGGRTTAALLAAALALAGCGRPAARRPAVARPATAAALPGPCLILTDPHGRDVLTVNAGAQVSAPLCELHVDSDEQFFAAKLLADSRLDVADLCVAGDISRHGGLVSDPRRGCPAVVDRYARPPPPEASAPCGPRPPRVNGGTVALRPGVYCGGLALNGAPHVTFAPGLYVIRGGDWTFGGGDYAGAGVSFFFADASKPVFQSGVAVQFSAPADGPRAGVLMDEAAGLPPSDLAFNAARRFRLDGLVHLPSRRATFNSASRLESDGLLAVFDSAVLNATRWTISGPWRSGA